MSTMAMTRWILSLLCLMAVLGAGGSVYAKNTRAMESLGRIVFLPNVNCKDDHSSAPLILKSENVLDLAKTDKVDHSGSGSKFFENSDELRQEIAKEAGIKGSEREVRFSVKSGFRQLAGPETDVIAAEVHAMRLHSKTYIPERASSNELPLNENFRNDFLKLPACVKDAHDDHGWQPYRDFMNRWGSHIVEVAYTGASYQSWSTAWCSNNYNRRQMEARACAKAEGLKGTDALEACKRYSEQDRQEASRLTAHDTRTVRGGTAETRRRLERDMATKDLIEKFLREGDVDDQPVGFQYRPIWEFLLERTDRHTDDAKRALALQAYYEGWMATGCPLVMTIGQANNNAQMMVPEYTKSKTPTGYYLCIRRCQGCHDHHNDCHFDAANKCCKAYGPSALRRVKYGDFVVQALDSDLGWCASDNGCQRRNDRSGCHCEKSNQEERCNYEFPLNPDDASLKYKIIWNQEGSHSHEAFGRLRRAMDF